MTASKIVTALKEVKPLPTGTGGQSHPSDPYQNTAQNTTDPTRQQASTGPPHQQATTDPIRQQATMRWGRTRRQFQITSNYPWRRDCFWPEPIAIQLT